MFKQPNTSILGSEPKETYNFPPVETINMGILRPWRIALTIKNVRVRFVIDLTRSLMIGRTDLSSNTIVDVDLSPFSADTLGVSRQHMILKLEGDNVVVVDRHSANGTRVNGQKLKPDESTPLQHGDELRLGGMVMQVELLINPLD